MHPFEQIFQIIREADTYREKCQLIQHLQILTEKRAHTLNGEDRRALAEFAFAEAAAIPAILESTEGSAARDDVSTYAAFLPVFVVLAYPSAQDMPEKDHDTMLALSAILQRERFVENAVDEAFENGIPTAADVDRLLCVVAPLHDEYRKGKFFVGLLHYGDKVGRMASDAKQKLAAYTASELRRYLAMEDFSAEVSCVLEVMADACSLYMTDELASLVGEVMMHGNGNRAILFYSLQTLIRTKQPVPKEKEVVDLLAHDLEYANLLYQTLRDAGRASLVPAECATPAYLAKSDLVHWLTYPTELGQVPDEIEYLGCVKKGFFKSEKYHVFRFKSTSDTLSEACKGRWLIGWSNDEGGTFSQFDLYDDYAGTTPEATLKHIKRKLL